MAYGIRNPMPHPKGSRIIPIVNEINPIPPVDTYSFRSILLLSSHLHLGIPRGHIPVGLHITIFKALLLYSILATCPVHLDLGSTTKLGELYKLKFLTVKLSPLAILISYGPKYSHRESVFKYHLPEFLSLSNRPRFTTI